jgi:hypothetical protein
MGANTNLTYNRISAKGVTAFAHTLTPKRNRNGIFEWSGRNALDDKLSTADTAAPIVATASVRAGTAANPVTLAERVKRKSVFKVRIPVDTKNAAGDTVLDYCDVDLTIATPVGTSDGVNRSAMVALGELIIDHATLVDIVFYGNEPY